MILKFLEIPYLIKLFLSGSADSNFALLYFTAIITAYTLLFSIITCSSILLSVDINTVISILYNH